MIFEDKLRKWRYKIPSLIYRSANVFGLIEHQPEPVSFVIEDSDWAIRRVGEYIKKEIDLLEQGLLSITTNPKRLTKHVVHFGSQYMWLSWGKHMSPLNQYVVSFFHGKHEDGQEVASHIDAFLESIPLLSMIVVSNRIVQKRLIKWGVPSEKIINIPIGVDTSLFLPPTKTQRLEARKSFGFNDDVIVIGSFQKDGIGWGEGLEPKLIKGPDVFLETIEILHKDHSLAVLLTGPARGYVKDGLNRIGVSYVHLYVDEYKELAKCYHSLDLYLVTSREEGGPMGLLESMASGLPVVSTAVGMAPDVIIDGQSGGITKDIKASLLADKVQSILLISKNKMNQQVILNSIKPCTWPVVAQRHLEEVYKPLIYKL